MHWKGGGDFWTNYAILNVLLDLEYTKIWEYNQFLLQKTETLTIWV